MSSAWDKEVALLRTLVAANLPKGTPPRDIEQAAKGILLLGTLPDQAYDVAWRHVRMDLARRRPGWRIESPLVADGQIQVDLPADCPHLHPHLLELVVRHALPDLIEDIQAREVHPPEPPWDDLDPGIRGAVWALWEAGLPTMDSGDGTSKLQGDDPHDPSCVTPFPHVVVLTTPTTMRRDVAKVIAVLKVAGVVVGTTSMEDLDANEVDVQANYADGQPVVICIDGPGLLRIEASP